MVAVCVSVLVIAWILMGLAMFSKRLGRVSDTVGRVGLILLVVALVACACVGSLNRLM